MVKNRKNGPPALAGLAAVTCRERLEAYLRENQVPFQLQHHPLAYTAQEVAESEHVPGKLLAKVVVVLVDGEMVLLALPAPFEIDWSQAAELLGAKQVRLAHEGEFAATFGDCEIGAMPPFGNLYGLPTYVDGALAKNETIVFQAGTHTETIGLMYADFERLVGPTVASFAGHRTGRHALLHRPKQAKGSGPLAEEGEVR
jgi:Ala-tRNA(Pro) deacylase